MASFKRKYKNKLDLWCWNPIAIERLGFARVCTTKIDGLNLEQTQAAGLQQGSNKNF